MVPYNVPVLIKVSDIFSIISNRICHMTVQIMKAQVHLNKLECRGKVHLFQ